MLDRAADECNRSLAVLYQDEQLVVVDKPAGLLVHRTIIDAHETRFALQLVRDQIGRRVYPVHRLDKAASGALAFALDPVTARTMSDAFAGARVRKVYLAVVRGWPAASGRIDHALTAVHDDLLSSADGTARPARTDYARVAAVELPCRVDRYPTSRYALLALTPLTGRRHQLRRHLAHISHPIIGDSTYGKGPHNRLYARLYGARRLLLACVGLGFAHPVNGAWVRITAPPAADFAAVLDGSGLGNDAWRPFAAAALRAPGSRDRSWSHENQSGSTT